MDEFDEDELFTVCLDDDGHPVQRAVRDMTASEVISAIDHLTVGSTRIGRCWPDGGQGTHGTGQECFPSPDMTRSTVRA